MRNLLANFVCGVLAILFAACFFLCARGIVAGDAVRFENRGRGMTYSVTSQEASLLYIYTRREFKDADGQVYYQNFWNSVPAEDAWALSVQSGLSPVGGPETTFLGFGLKQSESEFMGRRSMRTIRMEQTMIRVPMWFILGIIGVWPGMRFWRQSKVRTERLAKGYCVKCGFDLQGTYHHCPKCRTRAPIPAAFPVHSWEV